MFLLAVSIGAAGLGTYVVFHGLRGGYLQQSIKGVPEWPQGWSGKEAKLVGLFEILLGLAVVSAALAFFSGWLTGHPDSLEWSSFPAFILMVPTGLLFGGAGVVAVLIGRRDEYVGWIISGGMFIAMGLAVAGLWVARAV